MTTEAAAPAAPRRSDAGQVRLTDRDITGLLLLAEQYAAPYDLLAAALGAPPARLRAIAARWRAAGYAATGVLGPGPGVVLAHPGRDGRDRPRAGRARPPRWRGWRTSARCWPPGCGSRRPRLRRGRGRGGSRERRIRAALRRPAPGARTSRTPRSTGRRTERPAPYAGQVWAVEVELTPKPRRRTARIMAGLLARPRYAQVVYLTSPAARPVVTAHGRRACPSRAARPGRGPRPAPRRVHARAVTRPWASCGPSPCCGCCARRSAWLAHPAQRRGPGGAVAGHRSPRSLAAAAAWLRGWPPARLYRAAAWSAPVTAVWRGRRRAARPRLAGRRARPRCDDWQQAPACWRTAGSPRPCC